MQLLRALSARPVLGWRRLSAAGCARVLVAAAAALLLGTLLAHTALASGGPAIESESASDATATDATLQARIAPGASGPGVYYQFQVVRYYHEFLSEIACPPRAQLQGADGCDGAEVEGALPIGYLPAGSESQTVSLDLASAGFTLTPGQTYRFRVLVANAIRTEDTIQWQSPPTFGADETFVAATPPSVLSEAASNLTPDDATLEAQINPESLQEGDYLQFQLVKQPSEYLEAVACPPRTQLRGADGCQGTEVEGALPIQYLQAGSTPRSVSLDLASAGVSLAPGTTYHYRVLVVKRLPTEDTIQWSYPIVYGPDQTFTTPPAGGAPVIESVSVSHLSSSDATLEAQIDTEGLPTLYTFQLWSSPCSKHGAGCELIIGIPLPSGLLLGSFLSQSVSLDLNSAGVTLRGGEYGFSARATSAAGSTESHELGFEPPEAGGSPQTQQGSGTPSGAGSSSAPTGTPQGSANHAPLPHVSAPKGVRAGRHAKRIKHRKRKRRKRKSADRPAGRKTKLNARTRSG